MSEILVRGRCPEDKEPKFEAVILVGRSAVELDESMIAGINQIMASMTTLGAFMCNGVAQDYLVRVILGVAHKLQGANDDHMLCPLKTIVAGLEMLMQRRAVVVQRESTGLYALMEIEKASELPAPTEDKGGGIVGEPE